MEISSDTPKQPQVEGVADEPPAGAEQPMDEISFPPSLVPSMPESEPAPSDADNQRLSDRLLLVEQRFSGNFICVPLGEVV